MFFSVFLRFVTVSAGAGGEKITRMRGGESRFSDKMDCECSTDVRIVRIYLLDLLTYGYVLPCVLLYLNVNVNLEPSGETRGQ